MPVVGQDQTAPSDGKVELDSKSKRKQSDGKDDAKESSEKKDETKRRSDPTQPSDRLKDALRISENPKPNNTNNVQKNVTPMPPRLPTIRLRARVLVKDRPATAIIEVDESLYRVQKGSSFVVVSRDGTLQIRIDELDTSGVIVHVETLKQTIHLK